MRGRERAALGIDTGFAHLSRAGQRRTGTTKHDCHILLLQAHSRALQVLHTEAEPQQSPRGLQTQIPALKATPCHLRTKGPQSLRRQTQGEVKPSGICVALITGVLLSIATPASALPAGFAGKGTEAGQLESAEGVAVEQKTGDVYVADRENNRVDEFGPEGEFLLAWGWGVADGHTAAPQTCTTTCFRGLAGTGPGQLDEPRGIAVDNDPSSPSRGDVYVVEPAADRVQKFGPHGEFLLTLGGKVDKTSGANVCTAESGDECGVGESGSGSGEFVALEGGSIAVGPTGSLYVGDENRVQKLSPTGAVEQDIALIGAGFPNALAVDSAGDLYIHSFALSGVHEYEASGTELPPPRDLTVGNSSSVALEEADNLFVSGDNLQINEYDPSGTQLTSFGTGIKGDQGSAYGDTAKSLYLLVEKGTHVVLEQPHRRKLRSVGSRVATREPLLRTRHLRETSPR